MAYVGYPAGSMQAPQSGIPGGGIVPVTGLGAPGTSAGAGPGYFEELMNRLKGAGAGTREAGRRVAEAAGTPRGQAVAGLAPLGTDRQAQRTTLQVHQAARDGEVEHVQAGLGAGADRGRDLG